MLVKPDATLIARMLILQHGRDCRDLAQKKAHELDAAGNTGGLAYWQRVLDAIEDELSPSASAARH
jgi:butyrate kinase